jgi:hypothetical protein
MDSFGGLIKENKKHNKQSYETFEIIFRAGVGRCGVQLQ